MNIQRWCLALFSVAALTSCGHKSGKQETSGATDNPSGSAMMASGSTAASGSASSAAPAAKPDEGKPEPVAKEPPAPAAEVAEPVKGDLDTYVKDLPGSGKLLATIETSMGTFHCELFGDKAPIAVANFVGLATGKKPWRNPKTNEVVTNTPYFDGLTFHRVIPGFMIQGGDPLGEGVGGPGYTFDTEIDPSLKLDAGMLAMANTGRPHSNGSQFFITEVPRHELDGGYTVFGRCKEPDLVKKIAAVPRDPNDKPETPVTINHVKISHGA